MINALPPRRRAALMLSLLIPWLAASSAEARRERLRLDHVSIDLPGSPAQLLATDIDSDGDIDLVIITAITEWDQLSIEESTEMEDLGLVEVLTIVPALMDRRELRVYLADGEGGFETVAPMELGLDVLALAAGPPQAPVLALRDGGVAALRFDGNLSFEPLIAHAPVMAGTGTFLPRLDFTRDIDGDGRLDVLLPADRGLAIYPSRRSEGVSGLFDASPTAVVELPTDDFANRGGRTLRHYPLPAIRDVDGDGLPDLLFKSRKKLWSSFQVAKNLGDGRFGEATSAIERDNDPSDGFDPVVAFIDIDGDGRAEHITQQSLVDPEAGTRQEIREAKRPPHRYQLFRSTSQFQSEEEPYSQFDATGYTFDVANSDSDLSIPGGLQDLDGDGRMDLIAINLDFSVFQMMKVIATRTFAMKLDFKLYCQEDGGRFREIANADLSGDFRINLNDVKIHQLSLFDGDFDGDGRADFVQLGRGTEVTIHRGQDGCVYPSKPDLAIKLKRAPSDVGLVHVDDIDGDGLSDLWIVQPNRIDEPGVTPPVRVDLYLSGGEA